jgi:hypothetical protein
VLAAPWRVRLLLLALASLPLVRPFAMLECSCEHLMLAAPWRVRLLLLALASLPLVRACAPLTVPPWAAVNAVSLSSLASLARAVVLGGGMALRFKCIGGGLPWTLQTLKRETLNAGGGVRLRQGRVGAAAAARAGPAVLGWTRKPLKPKTLNAGGGVRRQHGRVNAAATARPGACCTKLEPDFRI